MKKQFSIDHETSQIWHKSTRTQHLQSAIFAHASEIWNKYVENRRPWYIQGRHLAANVTSSNAWPVSLTNLEYNFGFW
jgi:hypothetical protein